ncbi:unnamed protein product [Calypogeia fissa]
MVCTKVNQPLTILNIPEENPNVIVNGRVQGCSTATGRSTLRTVDTAQQLDLNGWVRSLTDGLVEAMFFGQSAAVDSLVQKCHQGPSAAKVSNVEVSDWNEEVPKGFEQKPTIW